MKAALVERPAISQSAMPAKMLSQNGAWRRMVLLQHDFSSRLAAP